MKKNFRYSSLVLTAILFALALVVGGCGGSGGGVSSPGASLTTSKSTGQAKVTIKWPAKPAGRLIPVASNSIVISISFNGSVVASQSATNPGNGGSTNVFFPTLPVGQLAVTASAFPNADGTGTAQASGSSTLNVTNGGTATLNLTMDSTIATLTIGSSFTNPLAIGATQTLSVQALDASGAVVLVTPSNFIWSSSNTAAATVTSPGQTSTLTAGASGDSTITVLETDSGATATLLAQVRGPVTTLTITAEQPVIFMGAIMQFTLIATDSAGNSVANPPGLAWSSSDPSVAQISSTLGLCQAQVNGAVTTSQTVTITASATGVASSTSTLTVLAGSGAGTFLSPHTVTLLGNTQQQFEIYTGTTKATSVVWSLPAIPNATGSLGTIDGNGLYTAPATAPTVSTLPQTVTVQGATPGGTFTAIVTIVTPP